MFNVMLSGEVVDHRLQKAKFKIAGSDKSSEVGDESYMVGARNSDYPRH